MSPGYMIGGTTDCSSHRQSEMYGITAASFRAGPVTLLTLRIEKIGLKDAGQCIEPYVTISVRDLDRVDLNPVQDTTVSTQLKGQVLHIVKRLCYLLSDMGGPLPPAMGGPLPTHFSPFCNPVVITRFVRFTVVCQFAYNRRNLSFPGKQVPATGVVPSVSDQRFSLRSFKYSSEGIRTATDGWTILSNGGRTTSSAGKQVPATGVVPPVSDQRFSRRRFKYSSEGRRTTSSAGGRTTSSAGGRTTSSAGGRTTSSAGGRTTSSTGTCLLLDRHGRSSDFRHPLPFQPDISGPRTSSPHTGRFCNYMDGRTTSSADGRTTSSADAAYEQLLPTYDSSLVRLLFRRHMDSGRWAGHFLGQWEDHFLGRWVDHFLGRRRLFYRPTFPLCPYGPVPPRPFCKVF
ncbi:hypothetical protein HF521_008052 [Silurus meridionalis]|uniref:C2 Aida-type domain-containing protein n=1 Tax=Silurus meridionalis TaxID=175797 RepID=A0A8T0AMZ6_SILME|nr:hypothetical protein HF521_008052 [Silurus meridionalis]